MVAWESINWASNSNFIILSILHTQQLNMSSISPDFKLMSDSKEYLNTYNVKMQVLVWLDTPGMCTALFHCQGYGHFLSYVSTKSYLKAIFSLPFIRC